MQSSEELRQELIRRVGKGQREGWEDPRLTQAGGRVLLRVIHYSSVINYLQILTVCTTANREEE